MTGASASNHAAGGADHPATAGKPEVARPDQSAGENIQPLTLPEAMRYLLPCANPWTRHALASQMAGRWRRLLTLHDRLPLRTIHNYRGEVVHLTALPLPVADTHARAWLPWALHTLTSEVSQLMMQLNIAPDALPAAIAVGANAEELPANTDDDIL